MRILVTNDDGIDSPGLFTLTRALVEAGHDVEVAAPSRDYSGSGSSLGSIEHGLQIEYHEHRLAGLDVPAVAIDAPPAFAVLSAFTGLFGSRPDLVVSGINDGFNTGRLVLTSSTVSAVLTAGSLGARGLAVSAGFAPDGRLDTAAEVAARTVDWMVEHSAPRTVLNMNVPDLALADLKGIRSAGLGPRGLMGLRLLKSDDVITLERFVNAEGLGDDTDSALVRDGYVAISMLPSVSRAVPIADADGPAGPVEQALWAVPPTAAVAR